MLERGCGLRDEDESGVCGVWEWKVLGDVGKGEERLLMSLEEEIMEDEADEADEERTSVGMVGGRSFGVNLLLLCHFPTGAGESGEEGGSGSGFE